MKQCECSLPDEHKSGTGSVGRANISGLSRLARGTLDETHKYVSRLYRYLNSHSATIFAVIFQL